MEASSRSIGSTRAAQSPSSSASQSGSWPSSNLLRECQACPRPRRLGLNPQMLLGGGLSCRTTAPRTRRVAMEIRVTGSGQNRQAQRVLTAPKAMSEDQARGWASQTRVTRAKRLIPRLECKPCGRVLPAKLQDRFSQYHATTNLAAPSPLSQASNRCRISPRRKHHRPRWPPRIGSGRMALIHLCPDQKRLLPLRYPALDRQNAANWVPAQWSKVSRQRENAHH